MEIEIFVDGHGFSEEKVILVAAGSTVSDLLLAVVPEDREGILVFVEEHNDPISHESTVEVLIELGGTIHLHRHKEIEVRVNYEKASEAKKWPPSTRIRDVLSWAIGKPEFHVDRSFADEMRLALPGAREVLAGDVPIGRLSGHGHEIILDMVRGILPNGGGCNDA